MDLLEQLLQREEELQFASFSEDTAWQLGSRLVERARREALPVVIDIQRGMHQRFHCSLRGTSPDNDEWVKRKSRSVYRFGHSSLYMGELLKSRNQTIICWSWKRSAATWYQEHELVCALARTLT
jgi:uncharacterized protein (UPF0303 family)